MSICRDRADMQFNYTSTKISKTGNIKAFITTYYSSSSVFLAKKTPSVVKNWRESTAPESCQAAKIGFLFLFSDELVQNCLTPSQVFAQNSSILSEYSAQPHRFLKSHEALETAHSMTMASSFSSFVRMCTGQL